jgi:hypothetical protein
MEPQPEPKKTHKQKRWEMLDRQYSPDNPDYVTPRIEEKVSKEGELDQEMIKNITESLDNARNLEEVGEIARKYINEGHSEELFTAFAMYERREDYLYEAFYEESKIIEILKTIDAVKNIKEVQLLKAEGVDDRISLRIELTARKWLITTDVVLSGRLINKGNGVALEDRYELTATTAEKKVKSLFAEHVNSIGEKVKEYIERETGKKVEKMEIANGELKVTYK